MTINLKIALSAGVCAAAFAAPAMAQTADNATATTSAAATVTSQPASDPGDIVVTASRRSERLQDVPIAVSVIGAETLKDSGFQKLTDIQYQTSGVQFGTSPNDSGFRLRGVGSAGGFSSSSESNVATVVDNVVIPFGNPVGSLGDLERVEVLKGPQGTQFGKNASSGVVNITTLKPNFRAFGAHAFASYGSLNEVDANLAINAPLSSNAALGVYTFYRRNDGFINNVVRNEKWGGEKSYGARAKLLFEPTSDLSIYLIADYSKVVDKGPGQLWTINRLPDDIAMIPLMGARFGNLAALGVTPGFNNDKSVEEYPGYTSEKNFGGSLEIDKSLGDYKLTSITAYRRLDQGPQVFAIDGTSFPVFTAQQSGVDQNFYSQEVRLTSPSDRALQFTTGVYLSRRTVGDDNDFNRAQLRPAVPFDPVIVDISGGQGNTQTRSDSAAVFVDGKYKITEQFSAIGGLRYQYDKVHAQFFSILDPAFPPGPSAAGFVVPYTPSPLQTGSTKKGDYSGRVGVEYKPSRDLLFFATLARGYLGPTVTFSGLTGTKSNVGAQTVRDITIGMKSQFLDRHATFNANLFFDKYKNLQTSVFDGVEFLTENAGGFSAKGFEADANYRFSRMFSINGSFTYSDTKFTDYLTACPADLKPGFTCDFSTGTGLVQAAGEPLSGAPKYSGTLGANLKVPLGSRLMFDAATNVYYRSRVQYAVAERYSFQNGYTTVGLNAGIGDANGNWRIGAFARNLFDKRFQAAVIALPFADAGAYVNWMTREGRRTVGVNAELKF